VKSAFIIKEDKSIGFNTGAYNKDTRLIIDPVIRVWGTFNGGKKIDVLSACKFDSHNNIVACGMTESENLASQGRLSN
jgi:hypothetical protein